MNLLVDAHADIAYNMLKYGRDYTRPVAETRTLEAGSHTVQENGDTLISWYEYQRANIAVIFSTLFASPIRSNFFSFAIQSNNILIITPSLYLSYLQTTII